MSRERVPVENYDVPYGRMSHLAHPALASGVRFMKLVDDQGREVWSPPENRLDQIEVLAQAAFSAARCLRRLAPALKVDVEQACIEALVTVDGITTGEIEA
jgi:hypothetical protein